MPVTTMGPGCPDCVWHLQAPSIGAKPIGDISSPTVTAESRNGR